jgi:hypothetical protein
VIEKLFRASNILQMNATLCYDFVKYFAEKFGGKNGVIYSKQI